MILSIILLQAERRAPTRACHQEEEQGRSERRPRAQQCALLRCSSSSGSGHQHHWHGRGDRGGILRSSPRRGHQSDRPPGPCAAVHRAEPQQTVPTSSGSHGLHFPHPRAAESDPSGYGRQRLANILACFPPAVFGCQCCCVSMSTIISTNFL